MHGIILTELERFVSEHHGGDAWREILVRSGLGTKVYVTSTSYPDGDVLAIVTTASQMTGVPAADLMHAFGKALVPGLVRVYGRQMKKGWRTLDTIEHTEQTMHTVVRRQNPGADPPRLRCERLSPEEVSVIYTSGRKMCAVAKGIIQGLADHFQERVVLRETECMLKGDAQCRISVRVPRSETPRGSQEQRPR